MGIRGKRLGKPRAAVVPLPGADGPGVRWRGLSVLRRFWVVGAGETWPWDFHPDERHAEPVRRSETRMPCVIPRGRSQGIRAQQHPGLKAVSGWLPLPLREGLGLLAKALRRQGAGLASHLLCGCEPPLGCFDLRQSLPRPVQQHSAIDHEVPPIGYLPLRVSSLRPQCHPLSRWAVTSLGFVLRGSELAEAQRLTGQPGRRSMTLATTSTKAAPPLLRRHEMPRPRETRSCDDTAMLAEPGNATKHVITYVEGDTPHLTPEHLRLRHCPVAAPASVEAEMRARDGLWHGEGDLAGQRPSRVDGAAEFFRGVEDKRLGVRPVCVIEKVELRVVHLDGRVPIEREVCADDEELLALLGDVAEPRRPGTDAAPKRRLHDRDVDLCRAWRRRGAAEDRPQRGKRLLLFALASTCREDDGRCDGDDQDRSHGVILQGEEAA